MDGERGVGMELDERFQSHGTMEVLKNGVAERSVKAEAVRRRVKREAKRRFERSSVEGLVIHLFVVVNSYSLIYRSVQVVIYYCYYYYYYYFIIGLNLKFSIKQINGIWCGS